MTKLRKEQLSLEKTCATTIDLNKRLQTVGLCAHAVLQRSERKIKTLQSKIASLSVNNDTFLNTKTAYLETQTEHQKETVLNEMQVELPGEDPSELIEILIRELEKSPNLTS